MTIGRAARPPGRWVGPAVGGLLLLAGCAGTPAPAVVGTGEQLVGQECCMATDVPPTVNGVSTGHNGWDIALIYWMVPHDAVASQMAALAPAQAQSQAVKDVAAAIDDATGAKYLLMSRLAVAWGQQVPSTDPNAATGHDHGGGLDESATAATLVPLTGPTFDREFLTIMIAHHQAALPIARATIDNGENAETRQLAEQVISVQSAEIDRMQTLLDGMA